MKLNLKAITEGYVIFAVNDRRFWSYEAADAACDAERGDCQFKGWNLWFWLICDKRGPWRGFYIRQT